MVWCGVEVDGVFLRWISWGHCRWWPGVSPGAGWADCHAGTGEGCLAVKHLQEWDILVEVYNGECEYDVCFGWGIAYFFDVKAELGDKTLYLFSSLIFFFFPTSFISFDFPPFHLSSPWQPTCAGTGVPVIPAIRGIRKVATVAVQSSCHPWRLEDCWLSDCPVLWAPQWLAPVLAAEIPAPNSSGSRSGVFENYGCFSLSHSH